MSHNILNGSSVILCLCVDVLNGGEHCGELVKECRGNMMGFRVPPTVVVDTGASQNAMEEAENGHLLDLQAEGNRME